MERKPYIMGRIIHVGNFLEQMPHRLLMEAFSQKDASGFYINVTDATLPMNNGKYKIGEPASDAIVVPCTIEELEKHAFPLIHTYINDIT